MGKKSRGRCRGCGGERKECKHDGCRRRCGCLVVERKIAQVVVGRERKRLICRRHAGRHKGRHGAVEVERKGRCKGKQACKGRWVRCD